MHIFYRVFGLSTNLTVIACNFTHRIWDGTSTRVHESSFDISISTYVLGHTPRPSMVGASLALGNGPGWVCGTN